MAATFVAAGARRLVAGPSASEPRSGYAPTYYPGTPNGGEAQKITLAVGQEMQNTDFGLVPVRLVEGHRHGHRFGRPAARRGDGLGDAAQQRRRRRHDDVPHGRRRAAPTRTVTSR